MTLKNVVDSIFNPIYSLTNSQPCEDSKHTNRFM